MYFNRCFYRFAFVLCTLFLLCSCKKDRLDKTPIDIDFGKNFIEHTLAGSFWEYTTTLNGDTLTSSPAKVFKLKQDSIIKDNAYKVFALQQGNDTILPFFIYRFVVNSIFEPRLLNGDPTAVLEVPIIDLNRNLGETWEVQNSSTFKQIHFIDSVGLNFMGFDKVFKIIRESYQEEKLTAQTAYYYQATVGLLYRKTDDFQTGAKFIRWLSNHELLYQ